MSPGSESGNCCNLNSLTDASHVKINKLKSVSKSVGLKD